MTHILPRPRVSAQPKLAALPPHSAPARHGTSWFSVVQSDMDALLATLPADWSVFAPVPLGAPLTEYLLVGPGGIFTVLAEQHSGELVWVEKQTLRVSGRRTAAILDAEFEARRITRLLRERMPLRAPVCPVIALVGARFLGVRGKAAPVKVVAAHALQGWLVALPTTLRPIERMELAAVIDNPLTWGTRPSIGDGRGGYPTPLAG